MTNQYKSTKRFQNIHSFFNFLFGFWVIYTIALFPLAKFSPSTFSFSTPLELKETINLATTESGDLVILEGIKGKMKFQAFKKDILPKEYYYKVASMFFLSLFFVFIFYHLKGISQSIMDKKPFYLQNQKRLKYIGFALVALAIIDPFIKTINNYHLAIDTTCLALDPDNNFNILGIDWVYLIAGLGTLLLAEVFSAGNELKQETELTI